jgi:hypothetical protein
MQFTAMLRCSTWRMPGWRWSTARVFSRDSPWKVARWTGRPIHEIWGVLWLVIRLLSVRADVSSSVRSILVQNDCTAFPSTLVSMLELSPPLPILPLLRVARLSGLNTFIETAQPPSMKSVSSSVTVVTVNLERETSHLWVNLHDFVFLLYCYLW